jgi:uroporphyrinogen-III decarboxylase
LNARECFLNALHFRSIDHIPLIEVEGIEPETMVRWYTEGLSAIQDLRNYIDLQISYQSEIFPPSLRSYLGLDQIETLPVDFFPIPRFAPKTLEEDERYVVQRNILGMTVRSSKDRPSMIFTFLEHPIKDLSDWEKMRMRFDARDPRRYPVTWTDELIQHYETAEHPIGLVLAPGLCELGLYMMGLKRFLIAQVQDPELIREMFRSHSEFLIEASKEAVRRARIDFVAFSEDLAYNSGPFMSPEVYEQLWLPYHKKIIDFLKDSGIDIIVLWSSGNLRPLIPLFLKAGFNCLWPLQATAKMDAVELRKEYGRNLLLVGNIAKEALIKGKEAISKEVSHKLNYLMEQGGYIPAIDDRVPPDVPLQNYAYYIGLLKKFRFAKP